MAYTRYIFSITFDINGKREMGLKFSGLVLDPFLYNGFNLAILQSLGKSPEEMEILHIFVIGFARIFAPSFKNLPEILSIPAAFEMSVNCKTSKTFFSVVKFRLKLSFSSMYPGTKFQLIWRTSDFGTKFAPKNMSEKKFK